ncbi:hypothetical protein JMJ35_003712 [Cladonia borealis]|uniref:Phosphoribulokinase/uridine kinase domain-containing protein n=1 Tax=Cladonia borealis TaxID=184061 RepID=A0AA39V8Z4_9LECA|nr:hypothetical protein JMJ35_003712 [Cladonia borealis]
MTTTTPSPPSPPPLLIALSGPTSSGKTTLATALRHIFAPPTYPPGILLIHQDDFYKTDEEIPLTEKGIKDWDFFALRSLKLACTLQVKTACPNRRFSPPRHLRPPLPKIPLRYKNPPSR